MIKMSAITNNMTNKARELDIKIRESRIEGFRKEIQKLYNKIDELEKGIQQEAAELTELRAEA